MTQRDALKRIRKKRWVKFLTRPYPPFFIFMHMSIYLLEFKALFGLRFPHSLYVSTDGIVAIYRDQTTIKRVENHIVDLLYHDREKVRALMKEAERSVAVMKKMIKNKKRYAPRSFNDFIKITEFAQWLFVRFTVIPYYLGITIERRCDLKKTFFKRLLTSVQRFRHVDYFDTWRDTILYPYLSRFAREHAIPRQLIAQFLLAEMINIERGKRRVPVYELRRRLRSFVLLSLNGTTELVSSARFTRCVQHIVEDDVERKRSVVEGKTAYSGRVVGRVRRVFTVRDLKKFRNGEILVAISTGIYLLPAIHKSSAIVTDEGGVMSHAAVISRELKIPCIIGTKIATSVFKDGDRVEVDAEKGIVRKI